MPSAIIKFYDYSLRMPNDIIYILIIKTSWMRPW